MKGNEEKGFESLFLQRDCWAVTGLSWGCAGKALPDHTASIVYSPQVHSKHLKCRRDIFVTMGWRNHNSGPSWCGEYSSVVEGERPVQGWRSNRHNISASLPLSIKEFGSFLGFVTLKLRLGRVTTSLTESISKSLLLNFKLPHRKLHRSNHQ